MIYDYLNKQTNKQTIDQLQVIRALAFIGIFTSHCGVLDYGPWGVSVFFVLSGFLMTYAYYEKCLTATFKESISFSLNGVAWYLSVCLFLYAVFPTMINKIKKSSLQKVIFWAIAIYVSQVVIGTVSQFVNLSDFHIDNFSKWLVYICPILEWGISSLDVVQGVFT